MTVKNGGIEHFWGQVDSDQEVQPFHDLIVQQKLQMPFRCPFASAPENHIVPLYGAAADVLYLL